jgi:hypothetical protein
MEVTATTQTTVFYTVVTPECERHFLTAWQVIAFLSNIDTETQKN